MNQARLKVVTLIALMFALTGCNGLDHQNDVIDLRSEAARIAETPRNYINYYFGPIDKDASLGERFLHANPMIRMIYEYDKGIWMLAHDTVYDIGNTGTDVAVAIDISIGFDDTDRALLETYEFNSSASQLVRLVVDEGTGQAIITVILSLGKSGYDSMMSPGMEDDGYFHATVVPMALGGLKLQSLVKGVMKKVGFPSTIVSPKKPIAVRATVLSDPVPEAVLPAESGPSVVNPVTVIAEIPPDALPDLPKTLDLGVWKFLSKSVRTQAEKLYPNTQQPVSEAPTPVAVEAGKIIERFGEREFRGDANLYGATKVSELPVDDRLTYWPISEVPATAKSASFTVFKATLVADAHEIEIFLKIGSDEPLYTLVKDWQAKYPRLSITNSTPDTVYVRAVPSDFSELNLFLDNSAAQIPAVATTAKPAIISAPTANPELPKAVTAKTYEIWHLMDELSSNDFIQKTALRPLFEYSQVIQAEGGARALHCALGTPQLISLAKGALGKAAFSFELTYTRSKVILNLVMDNELAPHGSDLKNMLTEHGLLKNDWQLIETTPPDGIVTLVIEVPAERSGNLVKFVSELILKESAVDDGQVFFGDF